VDLEASELQERQLYIQLEEGGCRVGLKKMPKRGVEPIGRATQ